MEGLKKDNYYSAEMNKKYCSCSQLKSFEKCEAETMAELNGQYTREPSDSMLLGSYVDCKLLTPEDFPNFLETHPELFTNKGKLYSKYENGNAMIERCLKDRVFMNSLKGDHQTIFTGDIFGVPFKVKLDVFNDGKYITDLKTTSDINREEYDKEERKYIGFAQYYKYDLQAAIYQEVVFQKTGKRLPFFLSVVSNQKHPRLRIFEVDQDSMDNALENARDLIYRVAELKNGKEQPIRCEKCDYCADTEVLTGAVDWLGREWGD